MSEAVQRVTATQPCGERSTPRCRQLWITM